jgi:hypothetical protein
MKRFHSIIATLFTLCALFAGCAQEHNDTAHATADLHGKISMKTVAGEVSGFDCAVVAVLCPSTHRAADFTTGIFTAQQEFYFVVNIPQSFMTQYFLEEMSVTGKVYHPYERAVEPEQIHLLKGGEKKLVYESGYFYDPQGHKSMFNQGRVVDGTWVCDKCSGA